MVEAAEIGLLAPCEPFGILLSERVPGVYKSPRHDGCEYAGREERAVRTLVLGAGVVGVAAAYYLALAGTARRRATVFW